MCFWTSEHALCKPSIKAKELGQYLSNLLNVLCLITLCGFFGGHYVIAVFTIGLITTMYCTISNNTEYNIESSQRVVFLSGYLCIFSTIACCQVIASSNNIFTWIQLFGGLLFYGLTAYFSHQLYDELRLNCKK